MSIRITRAAVLLIAVTMISGMAVTVSGQEYRNTPVNVSKEKVKVNGKVFYSHIVLERQTLFSISKAYDISLEDIYKYNPTLKENGLIKNSIILIPAAEEPVAAPEPEAVKGPVIQAEPEHKVISEEPEKEAKEPVKKKKKKNHTVKWYENIDDIAARYGVTAEEIMMANGLSDRKLKTRMKLTIPEPGEYIVELKKEPEEVKDTTTIIQEPVEPDTEEILVPQQIRNEKVNVSMLLPLKADGTNGSRSNMDFYSGVLLAVKDLGESGINIDLSVFDIAEGKMAAAQEGIGNDDVIIGPVSVRDLYQTFSAVDSTDMVISPLDPKAEELVSLHSNMIQAPTPHKVQFEDLVSWMKEDLGAADKIILITEKGARLTETAKGIKNAIDSSGLAFSTFSYSILEGRDVLEPLGGMMTQEGVNRFLIASESEAFVNDVVRNLNVMIHQKYNVVLYSSSKIRSFDTIEAENFHKTNMHVSLTYYIDYEDERVKNFLLKYRALFGTEPNQFAFQGYDIASYFLEMRSRYGENWTEMLPLEEKSMLQSTFRCIKTEDGGYVNQGVRRIVYENNWTIRKVR